MPDESEQLLDRRVVAVWDGITVNELAERLGVKPVLLLKMLMDHGIFAAMEQALDVELATDMANEFGVSPSSKPPENTPSARYFFFSVTCIACWSWPS
jgi:hypothetical protein